MFVSDGVMECICVHKLEMFRLAQVKFASLLDFVVND